MNINHPSTVLKPDWVKIIRDNSADAEQLGTLTTQQLNLIFDQQWFKMFVPCEFGGLEMSLPEAVRLEESLGWADGSMGWTVTLCSGAGWFGGFLARGFAAGLFSYPKVCLGGSGAASGTAVMTENGYRVTGRWKYATGALHTTHFTANCIIKRGSETLVGDSGEPLIRPFIFERKDVNVINDWNTIGLKATGSHSFVVNDLEVSENNCFEITPDSTTSAASIYQYPFLQFAEATLAANISGMVLHFLDLTVEIFADKLSVKNLNAPRQKILSAGLLHAKTVLEEKRSAFYSALENSWQSILNDGSMPQHMSDAVSNVSRDLAKSGLREVNELYPYCGIIAANSSSEINRVWRDLHTASQHSLLALPV